MVNSLKYTVVIIKTIINSEKVLWPQCIRKRGRIKNTKFLKALFREDLLACVARRWWHQSNG